MTAPFNNDLVSVITPVYNYENYIGETIISVIEQDYPRWEMIIADDGSGDSTIQVIEKLAVSEPRIRLIRLGRHAGAAAARNAALEKACGRFIAFLDSDDLWHKDKLKKQKEFMESGQYPISFTSYELIGNKGDRLNKVIRSVPVTGLHQYIRNTIIGFSSAMIDRALTGEFKFMDLRSRSDTQLWISLMKKGYQAYGLDEVLMKYRIHGQSLSANKIKVARQTWKVYYSIEKLGLFTSLMAFCSYAFNAIKKRC